MLRPTVIFVLSLHSGARAQPSYAAPMIKQVVTAARARPGSEYELVAGRDTESDGG